MSFAFEAKGTMKAMDSIHISRPRQELKPHLVCFQLVALVVVDRVV